MISPICTCTTWESEVTLRQCPEHFHIWRGATRLYSVGRIIKTCWPQGKLPPQNILDNARDRGKEVDLLAAAYCGGQLTAVPAGIRHDSRDLFFKFQRWFDKQRFKKVEVQVLIGDIDHGGVLDFRFDDVPYDLKCTYNVEPTAVMQVAGYSELCGTIGKIIQVTERFNEPKLKDLHDEDLEDWMIMLEHWRMLKRRGQIKDEEEADSE